MGIKNLQKTSPAKFDVYFLKQLTGTIPGDVPHRFGQFFQASKYRQFLHICSVHDVTKTGERWPLLIVVNFPVACMCYVDI